MVASQALSLHRKDTLGGSAAAVKRNLYTVKIKVNMPEYDDIVTG
jgi:hypothetical protein